MFGQKKKKIKYLEKQLRESLADWSKLFNDYSQLQNELAALQRKAYIRNDKGQIVKYQK